MTDFQSRYQARNSAQTRANLTDSRTYIYRASKDCWAVASGGDLSAFKEVESVDPTIPPLTRFNRRSVFMYVIHRISQLDQMHGFTNKTGSIQVDGKKDSTKIAYGEWLALYRLADELCLWSARLSKEEEIEVRKLLVRNVPSKVRDDPNL